MATLLSETAASQTQNTSDYGDNFPRSRKVYLDGPSGIRVPFREITLTGGEPPLRVYDPSGPAGYPVEHGLSPIRRSWILARDVDAFTGVAWSTSRACPIS